MQHHCKNQSLTHYGHRRIHCTQQICMEQCCAACTCRSAIKSSMISPWRILVYLIAMETRLRHGLIALDFIAEWRVQAAQHCSMRKMAHEELKRCFVALLQSSSGKDICEWACPVSISKVQCHANHHISGIIKACFRWWWCMRWHANWLYYLTTGKGCGIIDSTRASSQIFLYQWTSFHNFWYWPSIRSVTSEHATLLSQLS